MIVTSDNNAIQQLFKIKINEIEPTEQKFEISSNKIKFIWLPPQKNRIK